MLLALDLNGSSLLVSGKLKESARRHMLQYLSQASVQDVGVASEELVRQREASEDLKKKAQRHLESLVVKFGGAGMT